MQRKRCRELPRHVEIGTTLQLMPSLAMRKLTMKNVVQYSAILILGIVVYSAYRKMNAVPEMSAVPNSLHDISDNDEHRVKLDREQHNARVKQHIKQVFEDLKRDYKADNTQREKENEENIKNEFLKDFRRINDAKVDRRIDNEDALDRPIHKEDTLDRRIDKEDTLDRRIDKEEALDRLINKEALERQINKAEILDRRINKEETLDALFNYDKVIGGGREVASARKYEVGGGKDDSDGADTINNEADLEAEIEERLAEVLKDAVNEVADGDADVQQAPYNADRAGGGDDTPFDEKQEFKEAVHHLEQKLSPKQMANLRILVNRKAGKMDDDHEFPPFVTAARQTTMDAVLQFISSVQQTAPGQKVHVYDLDLRDDQKKKLMTICGVKLHLFMKKLFPTHISSLENYNWRPVVIQTALAEFGHITWVNPEFRLNTQELAHLVHDSHDSGIVVIAQPAPYTTFAVTHPGMLEYLPTDKQKLQQEPHLEIKAIMIHNTDELHQKVMKVLTACALEENCISPPGAKSQCRFDFTGRKYADCHRYDESAMNILLKNLFNFDSSQFARTGKNYFLRYEPMLKPALKYCRNIEDIRL